MIVALYPNFSKEKAVPTSLELCDFLQNHNVEIYVEQKNSDYFLSKEYVKFGELREIISKCDFVIAIGGDGTILKSAHTASDFDKPVLGINTGRLGFMASVEIGEIGNIIKLFDKDLMIENRMMIDAVQIRNGEIISINSALNDIIVSRLCSKISDYKISADGKIISTVRADGVIFSTPTGSTAYALSAGGPIIEPNLEVIQMTPICPHSLFARTMLFSSDRILHVEYSTKNNLEMYFSVDGVREIKLEYGDILQIRKSEKTVKLVDVGGNTFFDAVNNKLMNSIK